MSEPKASDKQAPLPPSALQRWVRALSGSGRPAKEAEHRASQQGSDSELKARSADGPRLPQVELTALLDGVPESRKLLRHLAGVEHGLKYKDPTGMFLFQTDAALLRIALRQLDGLSPASPSRGLVALRSRIVSAIEAHDKREKTREMLAPRSDLLQTGKIEIGEGRASDFDRLSAQWRGPQPNA